jgi:hypothetical protein
LNIGRYKLGNGVLGGAKRAIGVAVKYANERQQFKTPIAQFGASGPKINSVKASTGNHKVVYFGFAFEQLNDVTVADTL